MRAPIATLGQNVSDLPGSAGLEALRHAAQHHDPKAAKVTASKFESLLAEQLVKNMRQTSMGDAMFPGSSSMYREMYDKEIAKRLTQGKGLGLQPMIRRALGDKTAATGASPTPAANAASALSLAKYVHAPAAGIPLPQAAAPAANTAAVAPGVGAARGVAGDTSSGIDQTRTESVPNVLSALGAETPALAALAASTISPAAPLSPIAPSMAGVQFASLAPQTALPSAHATLAASADAAAFANTLFAATPATTRTVPAANAAVASPGSARSATGAPATLPHDALNRNAAPASNEDFVNRVWPHAQRAAAALGVSPQVLVAQAALESGWGRHVGGDHNLFGIKAGSSWHGATRSVSTSEYENGTLHKESAKFRSYASIADSFDDYAALLKNNPRYAAALHAGGDNAAFARALQHAGYATDPGYAAKITAIANGPAFAGVLKNPSDGPLIASR